MKRFLLAALFIASWAFEGKTQCAAQVNVTTQPPTCNGGCNGVAVASTSGGSGNYIYSYYDAGNNAIGTNATQNNLCAGNYYVVVYDMTLACSDTASFTVTQPAAVFVNATANNASCFGSCDGMAWAVASGPNPPFTYLWTPGNYTQQTVAGLCAGTYTVTATNGLGCSTQQTVTVGQPSQITLVTTSSPSTCGNCDGMLASNVTGGTAPYIFSWSNGVTTQNQTNVCAGTYILTVTDINGCSVSSTVTVANSGSNLAASASATGSSCNPCTGSVNIIATGGVSPYTYQLNSTVQSTPNFTGLCAGVYTGIVTDDVGCQTTFGVTVPSNGISGLTVTNSVSNESGFGMQDGSIDLTLTGSTGPFTFAWSNGATTEDVFSLTAGNYSVTITDSNGDCVTYFYTINTSQNYGYISGTYFNDNNQNCIYDAGDTPLSSQPVILDGVTVGYTNAWGDYYVIANAGNHTITHSAPYTQPAGCNTSYNITLTNNGSSIGNDFAFSIPPVIDASVYIWSAGIVPGFNGSYNIYLSNYGNSPANGTLCIVIPDTLNYVSAVPAPSSVNGDTICWSYSNLLSTQTFILTYYCPADPGLLGMPLVACADVTVSNGTDINLSNNQYCYTRVVSGSFDPNDKSVSPAGDIELTEDEFTYLIRFQNTGNGPAVNIFVTDTIESDLDISSFEMLSASHTYTLQVLNNNTLRWKFDNINLPDSGSNEPASHGYIHFRIKSKNTVQYGDVINNTANIYFDFNPPVITNTTENEYVNLSAISESGEGKNLLSVYPNPVSDELFITSLQRESFNSIIIRDITGRIVHQTAGKGMSSIRIDTGGWAPGIYVIKTGNGHTARFIKK